MEALLAVLLGAALVALASTAVARAAAKDRVRRLSAELAAIRRAPRTVAPEPFVATADSSTPPLELVTAIPEAPKVQKTPSPPGTAIVPAPSPAAGHRAAEAIERTLAGLRDLEALLRGFPRAEGPGSAEVEETVSTPVAPGDDGALALLEAVQALEEIGDETSRLRDRLRSAEEASARLSSTARDAQTLLATVEARATGTSPLAGELSGLADRMNLLALNLALLAARAGEAGEPFHASGEELRGLFEEARRFSRELAAHGQRSAESSRRAAEAAAEVSLASAEQAAREVRATERLGRIRDLSSRLRAALESSRAASTIRDEYARKAESSLAATGRRLAAARRDREDERRLTAEIRARLEEIVRRTAEVRTSAEEAISALHGEAGPRPGSS